MAASSKSISRVFNKQKAINRWRRFCWMLFTRKPINNEPVFFHSDKKSPDRPFRTTFPATCSTRLTLGRVHQPESHGCTVPGNKAPPKYERPAACVLEGFIRRNESADDSSALGKLT